MKNNKPNMTINFKGPEGNIFYIMAKAAELISDKDKVEMSSRVTKQKSYEDAVKVVEEYVNIQGV